MTIYYGNFDKHTQNILVFSPKHSDSVAFERVEDYINWVRPERIYAAMYSVRYDEGTVTIVLDPREYRLNITKDKRTLLCLYCPHWPDQYRTTDSMVKDGPEVHENIYQQILTKSINADTNNGIE